jgi:SAM-dependent methyltransferase
MDLSGDFVALARQRVLDDPYLTCTPEEAASIFQVHDFEAQRLPEGLRGFFDAIVLESCLHHFWDPIAAMTHIVEGLAPGGVVLVLEGENRKGPIRNEYMAVMLDTATLERPYPRPILLEVLEHAGLPRAGGGRRTTAKSVEGAGGRGCAGLQRSVEPLRSRTQKWESTIGDELCLRTRPCEGRDHVRNTSKR